MQCEGRRVNSSTYNYYKSNSRNKGPNKIMYKKTIKVRKAGLGAVDVFVGEDMIRREPHLFMRWHGWGKS